MLLCIQTGLLWQIANTTASPLFEAAAQRFTVGRHVDDISTGFVILFSDKAIKVMWVMFMILFSDKAIGLFIGAASLVVFPGWAGALEDQNVYARHRLCDF